ISVAESKHIRSRMGLPAPNPQLNRDVTDVLLNEPSKNSDLVQSRWRRCGQRGDLLLDLGGSVTAPTGQIPVPISHLLPAGEPIRGWPPRRKEGDDHLPLQAAHWRHVIFLARSEERRVGKEYRGGWLSAL